MRKGRAHNSHPNKAADETKSRKQLRKQKKIEKKQKKRQYFENRNKPKYTNISNKSIQPPAVQTYLNKKSNDRQQQSAAVALKSKETKAKPGQKKQVKKAAKMETEDDRMIRLCQQKLGIAQGKDKYGKIAKKFGFDDDIFDFLDGISKKVYNQQQYEQKYEEDSPAGLQVRQMIEQNVDEKQDDEQQFVEYDGIDQQEYGNEEQDNYQQQQENMNSSDDGQQSGDANFQNDQQEISDKIQLDEQYDQMFDNLDQIQDRQFGYDSGDYRVKEQELSSSSYKKSKANKASEQVERRPKKFFNDPSLLKNQEQHNNIKQKATNSSSTHKQAMQESPQKQQVKKSMNSLFNKLSDGNVLLTFRELLKIIQSHPKSLIIPVFAELFTKFNLLIEKPLFHILATNVALLAALHYAVGNRFIAPVLQALTEKYCKIDAQPQNQAQVLQLGYSKRFQRLKNYSTIISLLYNYGSISGEFIQSYVGYLIGRMNKSNVQLIYIVIQKCGTYIRGRDPSTLKTVIGLVKGAIEVLKQRPGGSEQQQKVLFIQLQLNQIRFNKKSQSAIDQRMAFLQTFINKNVKKEIQREKEVFPLDFETLRNVTPQQLSRTNWWETDRQFNSNQNQQQDENNQNQGQKMDEVIKQKNKLFELAKSFHMVTQTKRNIFVCLMDSKDYLEATQRILELKIKNMQQVATVLVQICTLQPNFNPYYPFVAAKLASLMPKFRLHMQYALWDHLKLVGQYQLRRTSNLAKFAAKVIAQPMANCSLSLLKFYPDLSNLQAIDRTFLDIFFAYFFKKVKKDYLSKLVNKLRQDNNRDVKLGIQQYLSEFEAQPAIRQKVQICRRLLAVELDQRKLQQNDAYQ